MILKDVIDVLNKAYPENKQISIYYHADISHYPDEFVGVASYHDGYLDTSEDPDGWSLEDEISSYHIIEYMNNTLDISVNLGKW